MQRYFYLNACMYRENKMNYFFFGIRYLCDHMRISGGQTQRLRIEIHLLHLKIHSLKRYLHCYTVSSGFLFISSAFCWLLPWCISIVRCSLSCILYSIDSADSVFRNVSSISTQLSVCLVDHSHKPYQR